MTGGEDTPPAESSYKSQPTEFAFVRHAARTVCMAILGVWPVVW